MYSYQVEIFIDEAPMEKKIVDAWEPWTAARRVAKNFLDKFKKSNRVQGKFTFRCTRLK